VIPPQMSRSFDEVAAGQHSTLRMPITCARPSRNGDCPRPNAGGYPGSRISKSRLPARTCAGRYRRCELIVMPAFTRSRTTVGVSISFATQLRIMPKSVPNSKSRALSAVGSSFATLAKFDLKSEKQPLAAQNAVNLHRERQSGFRKVKKSRRFPMNALFKYHVPALAVAAASALLAFAADRRPQANLCRAHHPDKSSTPERRRRRRLHPALAAPEPIASTDTDSAVQAAGRRIFPHSSRLPRDGER